MTFQEAVQDGFSKYVQFSGRSSRSAFWYWYLFQVLVSAAALVLDLIIGITPVLLIVAGVVLLLPNLAVTFRRLHDTGRSGWWIVLEIFLPIIGTIVILVFMLMSSDGPNKYGAGPDTAAATS